MILKAKKDYTGLLIIITIIGVSLRLYSLRIPFTYDEAYTFLYFARKPFSSFIFSYNVPNNHIFHTILVKLSTMIFGNQIWTLRLPSFIFGIAIIPISYFFWKKATDSSTAIIATVLVATSTTLVFYSSQARGYSVQACLFIATFWIAAMMIEKVRSFHVVLLSLLITLGLFTVPTMLYGVGAVYLWLFVNAILIKNFGEKKKLLKAIVLSGILTIFLTMLCYYPIMFKHASVPVLTNAKIYSFSKIFIKVPSVLNDMTHFWNKDLNGFLFYILFAGWIACPIWLIRHNRSNIFLLLSLLLWLIIILLATRIIPPFQRVWLYFLPFYLGFSAIGLFGLTNIFLKGTGTLKDPIITLIIFFLIASSGFFAFQHIDRDVNKPTKSPDLVYEYLSDILQPGDFIGSHSLLMEPLIYFWFMDNTNYRKLYRRYKLNVFQIMDTDTVPSKPFSNPNEKVILSVFRKYDLKEMRNWLNQYVIKDKKLVEKELAAFGRLKIILFNLTDC